MLNFNVPPIVKAHLTTNHRFRLFLYQFQTSHQITSKKLTHSSGDNTGNTIRSQVKAVNNKLISILIFHLYATGKTIFRQILPGVFSTKLKLN